MTALQFISMGNQEYEKVLVRQMELRTQRQRNLIGNTIVIVEHPRVITAGRRPATEDFLLSPETLKEKGYAVHRVNRGGRLTYHGPGQMVAYFIVSLRTLGLTVPGFVSAVEESVIKTLKCYGVQGDRRAGCPGVWVENRKIASIGLAVDRGVSMHGMALNVHPDLEDFNVIVPCGMENCQMTSLQKETGNKVSLGEVEVQFREVARNLFENQTL